MFTGLEVRRAGAYSSGVALAAVRRAARLSPTRTVMRACLAALAAPLLLALARGAEAQDSSAVEDSVAVPACAAPDSAVLDSAVRATIAATRPKVITPKLIVVERAQQPDYRSLAAASWQRVALSDDISGVRTVIQVAAVRTDARTRVRQLLVRVPPNGALPSHWHSVDETQVVVRGTVRVRDGTGRVTTLGPGGFSFLPAGEPHALTAGPGEEALLLITASGEWDIRLPEEPRRVEPGATGRSR